MKSDLRRFTALGTTALVVVLGGQLVGAAAASAHTPTASLTCSGWSIGASAYDAAATNTYSYSIDGGAAVTGTFGASFGPITGTFAAGSGNHTLVGYVYENGDPAAQYSVVDNLSANNCLTYLVVPVAPTPTPPTCTSAGMATIPANTPTVTWSLSGNVATATAKGSNQFVGGVTTETFTENVLPQLDPTSAACTTHTTVTAPAFINGSCTIAPTLTGVANGTGYTVVVTGTPGFGNTVTVTYSALPGFHLDGTTTYTFTYAAQPDCRTVVTPVAPAVTQAACNPATGVDSGFVVTPTTTSGITYTVNGLVVTATANAGSTLGALPAGWTGNGTAATFTVTQVDPTCLITINPVAPTVSQSACAATGTTPTPPTVTLANTANVTYTASAGPYLAGGTAVVTATSLSGYTFDQAGLPAGWTLLGPVLSATQATYTVVFAAGPDCGVAAAPTFADAVCRASGATGSTLTLPASTGVDYVVDGTLTAAGTYPTSDGSAVTVTAQPQAGYTLVGTTSWTHQYDAKPTCVDVHGIVLHHPRRTLPVIAAAGSSLPFTGAPIGALVLLGGLMTAAGGALVLGARRRRTT